MLTPFGSTRRTRVEAAGDSNLLALVESCAPVVTVVGKSWDLHVTRVLETSLDENLNMVRDSVRFLRGKGKRVFFDAEHFFDGFRANPRYAVEVVLAAAEAGAEHIVLCDTNGGTLPEEVARIVSAVKYDTGARLGIHTHNDTDTAVASALAAVRAGATQVQGTINGYGERCGNANLISVAAAMSLKMGIRSLSDAQLGNLTQVSRYVAEIANIPHAPSQPYVGASAFAHKGGLHVAAVAKVKESYEHIRPELVGNANRVLVSELSGRGNILRKVQDLGLGVTLTPDQAAKLLERVKELESRGFQYEGAEASFDLLVRRSLPGYEAPFVLARTAVSSGQWVRAKKQALGKAEITVEVGGKKVSSSAAGNGPVNALDTALRQALVQSYPALSAVRLTDYKVRVVDERHGTAAVVRVLIESTDGERTWRTVGASANIIEASWMALADSLEWAIRA